MMGKESKEQEMNSRRKLYLGVAAIAIVTILNASAARLSAQQAAAAIHVGTNDIGGIVTGPNGPEAGVWVIAETTDLGTKFARIVVTDDQGRYLIPDLPKANYSIWVRGYGLVDSQKVSAAPGNTMNLAAVVAPDAAAAARYYPAIYWFSMLKIPDKSLFPGTGPQGNGMGTTQKSQAFWLDNVKSNGCVGCHQLGNLATRTIPAALGNFETAAEAWSRRIQSGQASQNMVATIGRFDTQRALELFGDWTDRVASGELPVSRPARPQGIERNLVVSLWDWGTPTSYLHDEISTDKRNPTVNAWGKIYGSPELSTDMIPILDPKNNTVSRVKLPVLDPKTPSTKNDPVYAPSAYWGEERIWDSQTVTHNPMFDEKGRVWFTSRIRPAANPAFCQQGSDHPSAKLTPVKQSGRQLAMYDPKTDKFTLINTCFGTHHLVFAQDANNTLWTSSGGAGDVVGWLDTKKFEETGDAEKSQGWTALVLDTNGNGKRDDYVGPNDPPDPAKDKQINASFYGIAVSPVDGSVWGSVRKFPGQLVRLVPGAHPPETALAEVYDVPFNEPKAPINGYGPRGMDIDSNGVVWTPLSSGHLASFDRRKCKGPLNGPNATGKQCPEGWTLYPYPGPQFQNLTDSGSAESAYYTWVDQHDTSGLGDNTPISTGNENESLIALVDGKMVSLRVPYPLGFYAKGLDGRIDDPNGGWKGRGLWTTFGNRTPFHVEGGKGNLPKVVHFQLRPDPLAD
jgi:hypothetical protein